jgi:hypothetical protein
MGISPFEATARERTRFPGPEAFAPSPAFLPTDVLSSDRAQTPDPEADAPSYFLVAQ